MTLNTTKVPIIALAALTLCLGQANAGQIYSHSFDDMTDVTPHAINTGTVGVSSDQSVESGNSLFFEHDPGGYTRADLVPNIAGWPDLTMTAIVRMYLVHDFNDSPFFRGGAGNTERSDAVRGKYYSTDTLWYRDGAGWTDSGVSWPVGEWVTIAQSLDGTTSKYEVYFAVGTDVTPSDLVGTGDYRSTTSGDIDTFAWYANISGEADFYIDKFEIYDGLGEGIIPEPSMVMMLVMSGLGALGLLRRCA